MSNSNVSARNLFWGQTNKSGETRITCSRVWDAERFLAARREEGASAKLEADQFTVSVHSEEEYKAQERA